MRTARHLPRLARRFLRYGCPARTLLFGPMSIGDDLLCTAVLREARLRGRPFGMMTNNPGLFAHNRDPARLLPVDDLFALALRRLGRLVIQPYYSSADPANPDRDVYGGNGHIIAQMCRLAGLQGEVTLRPHLHLTPDELAAGRLKEGQIALQSTAGGARLAFANKEWDPARFAEVARRLPAGTHPVQLGLASDPPLPGALDLRGRTTLREAAAVLAGSRLFIGLEGFLGHLARAAECPAVIVLGGRVRPETVGYPCNEYLSFPTPCSPCRQRSLCDFGRACLDGVAVGAVLEAVERMLARPRAPLAVGTALLP